jgi:hypothetical protein
MVYIEKGMKEKGKTRKDVNENEDRISSRYIEKWK